MNIGEFKHLVDSAGTSDAAMETDADEIVDRTLRELVVRVQRATEELEGFLQEHE